MVAGSAQSITLGRLGSLGSLAKLSHEKEYNPSCHFSVVILLYFKRKLQFFGTVRDFQTASTFVFVLCQFSFPAFGNKCATVRHRRILNSFLPFLHVTDGKT